MHDKRSFNHKRPITFCQRYWLSLRELLGNSSTARMAPLTLGPLFTECIFSYDIAIGSVLARLYSALRNVPSYFNNRAGRACIRSPTPVYSICNMGVTPRAK